MLIFGGKTPSPLAYAVYAFINVDNCERPLTFPSAVCKLTILVLLQNHTLLHITAQNCYQGFVKSYSLGFQENPRARSPLRKMVKPCLSTCYGDSSATNVPLCCKAATKKITFHYIIVTAVECTIAPIRRKKKFRCQKYPIETR